MKFCENNYFVKILMEPRVMRKRILTSFFVFFLLFEIPGAVYATLIVRGIGTITSSGQDNGKELQLIYDSDLNITWLDYSRYYVGGNHADWISGFEILLNGQLITDWRLPNALPVNGSAYNYNWGYNGSTDEGYNISAPGTIFSGTTENEMAYLFYNSLGNLGYYDNAQNIQSGWGLQNTGPFQNLNSFVYSTGSKYSPTTGDSSWVFDFYNGGQRNGGLGNGYALIVFSGDVSAVPEPATMVLFGTGLAGLAATRRKKKA